MACSLRKTLFLFPVLRSLTLKRLILKSGNEILSHKRIFVPQKLRFWYGTTLKIKSVLPCSLRKNYGRVFSLKIGSYKLVMASSPEAVKEMLIQKSADYAGRQQSSTNYARTLGKSAVDFL